MIGFLLLFSRSVNPELLRPLSIFALQQAEQAAEASLQANSLFQSVVTQPNPAIICEAYCVVLRTWTDTVCLGKSIARSQHGNAFFFSSVPMLENQQKAKTALPPRLKSLVQTDRKTIKNAAAVASASEAEIDSAFNCARNVLITQSMPCESQLTLHVIPIQADDAVVDCFVIATIKPHQFRSIRMKRFWLRDPELWQRFLMSWNPGEQNLDDWIAKVHTAPRCARASTAHKAKKSNCCFFVQKRKVAKSNSCFSEKCKKQQLIFGRKQVNFITPSDPERVCCSTSLWTDERHARTGLQGHVERMSKKVSEFWFESKDPGLAGIIPSSKRNQHFPNCKAKV